MNRRGSKGGERVPTGWESNLGRMRPNHSAVRSTLIQSKFVIPDKKLFGKCHNFFSWQVDLHH